MITGSQKKGRIKHSVIYALSFLSEKLPIVYS